MISSVHAIVKSRIPTIIAIGDAKVAAAVAITANNVQYIAAHLSRVDTGNMRGGWQVSGGKFTKRVFNNVHYTVYHEYGTIYMSAQPMLGPAIEVELPRFQARVRAAYV